MSVLVKVGSFVNDTAAGDEQAITGVGFEGTCLIALSADTQPADLETIQSMQAHSVGFARSAALDGTGQSQHGYSALWNGLIQWSGGSSDDGTTAVVLDTFNQANGAKGTHVLETFVSFDADGFTLRNDNAFTANLHHYVVLGGDVVAEPIQRPNWPTSVGTQTITGASAPPTVAIFLATTVQDDEAPDGFTWAMGWFDGTNQGTSAVQYQMFANPGSDHQYQATDACLAILDAVTGDLIAKARCTGFTDDGLTLDWDPAAPDVGAFTVILLSGVLAECGAALQPAVVGPQTISVPTVQPKAVLFLSGNQPASTSVGDNLRLSMGISDGAAQLGIWNGDTSGTTGVIANARNQRFMSSAATVTLAHPTAETTAMIDAQATVSTLDPDGQFFLNWTTVDGTPREVLYLALGPAVPPVPPFVPPVTVTHAIRRMRQAPHLWEKSAGRRIRYPGFQLIFEAGVPASDGDPLRFNLQWSDDGGHTWSNLHPITAGTVGQYAHRAIWRRLGQSRDRIFRVIESNRARIVLLDALLDPDPEVGSS